MTKDAIMFIAMPFDELMDLIEEKVFNGINKFNSKPLPVHTDKLLGIEEVCTVNYIFKALLFFIVEKIFNKMAT